MGIPGHWEWVILLVIVLIIFGPKKLPQLAQAIGKSVRELKNGMAGLSEEIKKPADQPREAENGPSVRPPGDEKARPVERSQAEQVQADQAEEEPKKEV